ncbi:MAG: efflux RND transporter periplasmic adaptor subunit, partial [Bacteroidales bacterium]|nr:efflux RND transporter periplasmic adaptor subunit [Bacteroidales bacterium]
ARLEYDLAEKEFEKNLELLKIYNQNTDNVDISRPFSVISPIAGEIVRNEIMTGQFLRTDAEPLITVANLSKVRIVANVKERDLYAIVPDDEVEIITESMPDRPVKGRIVYISDIMNEQTRSLEVYVECSNPDKILKSGMFVTVNFRHMLKDVFVIPSEAVYQDSDRSYLFLQSGEGTFIRREVRVQSVGNGELLVHSGLNEGNIIVTDGGIYLR